MPWNEVSGNLLSQLNETNTLLQSLAMAELYISTATLFHQLDLKLYDTVYERDIEVKKDCFLGEPSNESRGVRVTLG